MRQSRMIQVAMFQGGEDSPLFTGMPVPVFEKEARPAGISPEQGLLLEPACRTCMDTGEVRTNGTTVKPCWCAAGQEVRARKGARE